jgi:hypothetical protein
VERVFLVYVDESGETGLDLANPQQPLYLLLAALVPAGPDYEALSRQLEALSQDLQKRLQLGHPAPLHAVELYQRTGFFRRAPLPLSPEEAFVYFQRVLQTVAQVVPGWVGVYANKREMADILGDRKGRNLAEGLRRDLIQALLERLREELDRLSGYGFLLAEARYPAQDHGLWRQALAHLRATHPTPRLQGVPALVEKEHLPLAGADFPAYVLADYLKRSLGVGRRRPHMEEWFERFFGGKVALYPVGEEVLKRIKTY